MIYLNIRQCAEYLEGVSSQNIDNKPLSHILNEHFICDVSKVLKDRSQEIVAVSSLIMYGECTT